MDSQLTAGDAALHLFFTDDVYLVKESGVQYATTVSVDVPIAAEQARSTVLEQKTEFKYLGKNKRNILILVNDEQHDVSDEAGRELLRKIVKSVNLSANDFALLNYATCKGTNFEQLRAHFSCELVFAFGVTPLHLALCTAHPEHVMVSESGTRMIFAAELKVLDQHPASKKALWGSLQNLGL